jgi:hypothetical protein
LLIHWVIAGLDRGRLHWTDNVPQWLQALGLAAGSHALLQEPAIEQRESGDEDR